MRYQIREFDTKFLGLLVEDEVTAIVDTKSDNHDELIHIDPERILSNEARLALANGVCQALNNSLFIPEYPE